VQRKAFTNINAQLETLMKSQEMLQMSQEALVKTRRNEAVITLCMSTTITIGSTAGVIIYTLKAQAEA
jgi:hypothetical protein